MQVDRPTWYSPHDCPVCKQGSSLVYVACASCGEIWLECIEEGSGRFDCTLAPLGSEERCPRCNGAEDRLATSDELAARGLARV